MIVGVDSSITALGLAAIPGDWAANDWARIQARTIVTKPGSVDVMRFEHLARCVVSFCETVGADEVFIEDSSVWGGTTKRLCTLSGGIEHELYAKLAIIPRRVNVTSARKLLLGSVPRQQGVAKVVVQESLRSLGAHFEDDAQADAFAVANFGRSELGLWAVCAA